MLFTIPGNQRNNKPKNKGKGKVQPKVNIKKGVHVFLPLKERTHEEGLHEA